LNIHTITIRAIIARLGEITTAVVLAPCARAPPWDSMAAATDAGDPFGQTFK
jgi:hypothetical protein